MKVRAVIKLIEADGWRFVRQTAAIASSATRSSLVR